MEIRFATLQEILPLRREMIITGTKRDSPYFDGDQKPDTRHIAAFDGGVCIACATVLLSTWESRPAWQVRGMATALNRQREGTGTALLQFCETRLPEDTGVALFWCNARAAAVGFYEKNGWRIVSERFEVPGVGPHYRMLRETPGNTAS